MRRLGIPLAALVLFSGFAARADYLYIKIDLGQAYQTVPTTPAGLVATPTPNTNPKFGPKGNPNPMPMPIPNPNPNPNPNPIVPTSPGEGPFVYACIEIKNKPKFVGSKEVGGAYVFDHAFGRGARFITMPSLVPNVIKYTFIAKDSLAKEFEKTFKKELAQTKDPRKYLNAATWAFHHGLTKDFHATMEDLKKLDPKNPVVVNYNRVQNGLKKPPAGDDPFLKGLIADLKTEQFHAVAGEGGYYVALSNLPPGEFEGGVRRRLTRLQETLENFYYWFALNDQLAQPPLPQHKLMVVITKSVEEFYAKHAQWGAPAFLGDGFTPRRDNFILTSWRRVDDLYKMFDSNNQGLWKTLQFKKDAFVTGQIWDQPPGMRDTFTMGYVQTLTIVQKAMEDEGEVATLTHEGTRQLLFATGLMPRHVHTPEWISQGLSSYFETSPGAMYRGVGLPSWSNLVALKFFRMTKRLDKPGEVLQNVITDRYFRNAQKVLADLGDAPDKEKLADRAKEDMEMARATAWALAYYLIERRKTPQLLFKYCQELNSLPRDLDLDDRALEACFARVFDMGETRNPLRLDPAKLQTFAEAWFSEMAGLTLENPELQSEYLEVRRMSKKSSTAP